MIRNVINPSQVVAEEIEATSDQARSGLKAPEAAADDVESAGEANQERHQADHGPVPRNERLTSTSHSVPIYKCVINAHPEPVLTLYTLGKQKQHNCPIISTTTQTDKSIQIPGNWKQKIITGTPNHTTPNKAEKVTSKDQTKTVIKAKSNKTSLVKNKMYPLREGFEIF